jgi:hypothetical protein
MEEILIVILQGLFEFGLEVLSYLPLDWPWGPRGRREPAFLPMACSVWFFGGGLVAWISVQMFHHTLIQAPAFRIGNLVLAPVASAFLAQAVARRRKRRYLHIVPRNHFWQAFWFTLGLTTVRFAYALRT